MSTDAALARLQFLEEGSLSKQPPPRPWLLRGDDAATPVIPLSEVGLIVGAGGTSKTMATIALASSLATGRPWLGTFNPTLEGCGSVAIFLAEESQDECKRRFYWVAEAMQLSKEERRLVERRVLCAPLAGVKARLVNSGADTDVAHDFHHALGERRDDWKLVVFDSLSRFGGADTESSNSAAADFVNVLERFTKLPGSPTVACVHHTNQVSRDGRAVNAASARGVTALTDNARWMASMSVDDATGFVAMRITKSNYGPMYPSVGEAVLRRGEHGVLHRVTDAELAETRANRQATKSTKARSEDLDQEILAEARKHPDRYKSKSALAVAVGGTKGITLRAITVLVEDGRLEFTPNGCHVPAPPGARGLT